MVFRKLEIVSFGWLYSRAAQIWGRGIFASNSINDFDPNRVSIPIFGSLGRRFTTPQELRSRPFHLNISPKMVYF